MGGTMILQPIKQICSLSLFTSFSLSAPPQCKTPHKCHLTQPHDQVPSGRKINTWLIVNLLVGSEVEKCNLLLSFESYHSSCRPVSVCLGSLTFPAISLWLGENIWLLLKRPHADPGLLWSWLEKLFFSPLLFSPLFFFLIHPEAVLSIQERESVSQLKVYGCWRGACFPGIYHLQLIIK